MSLNNNPQLYLRHITSKHPDAYAKVRGSDKYPELFGTVSFFQTENGVIVVSNFFGLPKGEGNCGAKIFAFHIHEGEQCSGNSQDPFADAKSHYNPYDCMHPEHAGDLPPLFGNNGYAWSAVFTDRFKVKEIIGKTVIVHEKFDDFSTQPSGNAGAKIGCGVIKK